MVQIKKRSRKFANLALNVTVAEASDLLVNSNLPSAVLNCTPRCYLKMSPYSTVSTNKVKNTVSPQWNTSLRLKLKNPPTDSSKIGKRLPIDSYLILSLVVCDKKSTKKNYLGELRLSLLDVLKELQTQQDTGFRWFLLYSSKSEQKFVTGSIKCKFSISLNKSRRRKGDASPSNHIPVNLPDKPSITIQPSDDDVAKALDEAEAEEEAEREEEEEYEEEEDQQLRKEQFKENIDIRDEIDRYITGLETYLAALKAKGKDPLALLTIDDQNYYSSNAKVPENIEYHNLHRDYGDLLGDDEIHDDEDDLENRDEDDDSSEEHSSVDILKVKFPTGKRRLRSGSSTSLSSFYSAVDDSGNYSSTASMSDLPLTPPTSANYSLEKRKRFSKLRPNRKGASSPLNYEFSNRKNVVGILFLEVISASGLPPLNNSTRTGYDMDPFVVISFGTKVFRTSWRKHTLSPIFNERLIFEVLENEKNFDLSMHILDKDYLSFNDKVCSKSIPIKQFISSPDSLGENSSVKVIEKSDEESLKYKKKLFGKNPKRNVSNNDYTETLTTLEISMDIDEGSIKKHRSSSNIDPKLKIRVVFEPYSKLRQQLFRHLLTEFQGEDGSDEMDVIELGTFLESCGSNLGDSELATFFENQNKKPWVGEKLTIEEIIHEFEVFYENQDYYHDQQHHRGLQSHSSSTPMLASSLSSPSVPSLVSSNSFSSHLSSVASSHQPRKHIIQISHCPSCYNKARVNDDVDMIKHLAVCCSKDWSSVTRILKPSFTTPNAATRRWYSKALIKIAYGKIELGKNNANILVQDRKSGLIIEEKMSVYVRLGIKLLYRSFKRGNKNNEKIKKMLRRMSFKQGLKFDSPQSKTKIDSFIKFHSLDLTDCLIPDISKYKTFNDFFYRKLKPNARPIECLGNDKIAVSGADSRCCVFATIESSKQVWVKGRNFTVPKLLGPEFNSTDYDDGSIVIFRLAPQDYHRFHSSVSGTVTKIVKIEGEYYTVNPMAIRSKLDVFSENVRVLLEIDTIEFGKVIMICVGAMMVGSTVLSCKVGDKLERGDEVGYFKFGGSTILLLFERGKIVFDTDLVNNSMNSIETLVRVGMSIGHTPDQPEFEREYYDIETQTEETRLKIIRTLTGGDGDIEKMETYGPSWEVQNLELDDAFEFEIEEEKQDDTQDELI